MIGYHYTSAENWKAIQREGLQPYRVASLSNVAPQFGVSDMGVWVYTRRQRGMSHFGCILWQAITKKTEKVALLRVKYPKDWVITHMENGVPIQLTHDLDWRGLIFHKQTDIRVIQRAVPPENIQLVNIYDISTFADLYDRHEPRR